jgi:hypothetical protein
MFAAAILGGWLFIQNLHELEVRRHLRSLEYWQRAQFGRLTWRDAVCTETWTRRHADPQQESKKESDALIALGYLVRHTFLFSVPETNIFPDLDQRIRAAKLSDAHWDYSIYSNRIEAAVCISDLPTWEETIGKWERERLNATNKANLLHHQKAAQH